MALRWGYRSRVGMAGISVLPSSRPLDNPNTRPARDHDLSHAYVIGIGLPQISESYAFRVHFR